MTARKRAIATLDELIGSWTLSLRAANRAPRTIQQYVDESMAGFARWLVQNEPELRPANIRRRDVEQYLSEVVETRSASTAQTRYKALRLFFAWAAEEGEIADNPMALVRPPVVPEKPVAVLTKDELRALLKTDVIAEESLAAEARLVRPTQ
jgi:integrase/recombinase XerC